MQQVSLLGIPSVFALGRRKTRWKVVYQSSFGPAPKIAFKYVVGSFTLLSSSFSISTEAPAAASSSSSFPRLLWHIPEQAAVGRPAAYGALGPSPTYVVKPKEEQQKPPLSLFFSFGFACLVGHGRSSRGLVQAGFVLLLQGPAPYLL